MPVPDSKPATSDTPTSEQRRLGVLRSYGVLDTPREAMFDDIARLAAYICQAPIAMINLIDENRQWFKSEIGLGVREFAIGSHDYTQAFLQAGLLVVPDLRDDRRFSSSPLPARESLRFYAGAQLGSPDGYALGALCILDMKPRDLSEEQKALLLALARQAMAQLEARRELKLMAEGNRYRSRLMSVAAHDLKQPLQVVSMVTNLLQMKSPDPDTKSRLQLVLDSVERMGSELDRFAAASKQGPPASAPTITVFPVAVILQAVVTAWQVQAAQKGIHLRLVRSSALVSSDAAMLGAVLGILIGNAIKHSAGGVVLIGCRRRRGTLSIQVLDSGRGIDAERLSALADAVQQGKLHSDGVGMGLSIVQRTVEVLGHVMKIDSAEGRGSVFAIEVPIARE